MDEAPDERPLADLVAEVLVVGAQAGSSKIIWYRDLFHTLIAHMMRSTTIDPIYLFLK